MNDQTSKPTARWREVKHQAKERAAAKILALTGVKVNPDSLFDIQVDAGHSTRH